MKKEKTIVGEITTTRKGFGFIKNPIENPKDDKKDIYISPDNLNFALNGDIVEVLIQHGRDDIEGKVLKVIEKRKEVFVGTVEERDGKVGIIPDDKKAYIDIMLPKGEAEKVKKGDKVQTKITKWENPKENPEGKIIRIIGRKGENDAEMESIVLEKGFDISFPEEVEKEADKIEKVEKIISKEEIEKRRDMRSTLTFTIDPHDAKDFDDAISFKDLGGGKYEIGVHIADVSHYVREGTNLNREALKRGCSIYLVDRTIPMLPEILSNDVCSLNPNEDKLAFSAVFVMNEKGKVLERWFGRTVINSDHRFTYETAQETLDKRVGKYFEELNKLREIAKILEREKLNKGAIEFEQEEVSFKLNEKGWPIGIYKKKRLDTHKLVEEYMLLANREVAKFIHDSIKDKGHKHIGSIYRIHDIPDQERILDLSNFVKALGYSLKTKEGKVTAHEIKSLLKQIKGTEHEALIRTAAIRSMQKAIYSTKNIGHFGLAFEYYTHFTSPIRRYPDLLVHRVLAKHLRNEPFQENEIKDFERIAEQSTEREIDAAEAERASKKLKQVEYMSDKVGQVFQGVISGVTEWGLYVEEKETKSEGMIRIRELGEDFFEFNKKNYSIVGQKTKKKFTLGDSITFKVIGADLDKKTLDFAIA